MAKRETAAEKREREARAEERYGVRFIRDMEAATTLTELSKLANGSRPPAREGDRYHHWLGCALHDNPYDAAPRHMKEALEATLLRVRRAKAVPPTSE